MSTNGSLQKYNGSASGNKFVLSEREVFLSDPGKLEKMQTLLRQYIIVDNIQVVFHLNLLLTAIEPPVLATPVVDLGLKTAYQSYNRAIDASLLSKN